MKFLTWNIQRGGGKRIPSIIAEIASIAPDVICLTEVTFKKLSTLKQELSANGFAYIAEFCPETNDNSVLLASKTPFSVSNEKIERDRERWISAYLEQQDINLLCVHIPGATDAKFSADGFGISGEKRKEFFWNSVIEYAEAYRNKRSIIMGDFNTGLKEDAEGTPFKLSEFMLELRGTGFQDVWRHLNPEAKEYTWYWRRKSKEDGKLHNHNGFRLDYIFASPALQSSVVSAIHVHDVRERSISDHSLVFLELNI